MSTSALKRWSGLLVFLLFSLDLSAQPGGKIAVPFLLISPDTRSSGIGDASVATPPDIYSITGNPAKYAFMEDNAGIGVTFTPLQRRLIKDHNLFFISGVYRTGERESIAAGFRYHAMGQVQFADVLGNSSGVYNPKEFSFEFAYIRKLFDCFSVSSTVKYINADLKAIDLERAGASVASTAAADLGLFYTVPGRHKLSIGAHLKNIGPSMLYGAEKLPLPAFINVGAAYNMIDQGNNVFIFTAEAGKSLREKNGGGSGFSTGIEYSVDKRFSVRGGYHGDQFQSYLTCGLGILIKRMSVGYSFQFDISEYTGLGNTSRFGLSYSL
jgi:hypothetical protein